MIYDAAIPIGWKGDGILSFVGHWEDLAKYVLSAGVPVVEISSVRKDLGIPCVIEDNEAIGRLGDNCFPGSDGRAIAITEDGTDHTFAKFCRAVARLIGRQFH